MTNILLIFVAPFFFMFEVLNLFGYREQDVKEWNKFIAKEIEAFRKTKSK